MKADVMARGLLRVAAGRSQRALLAVALLGGCGSSGPTPAETDRLAGADGDSPAATPASSSDGAAPSNTGTVPSLADPGEAGFVDPTEQPPSDAAEPAAGGSAGSTNDGGVMTPGVYRGSYFVPVPSELEAYATFDVDRIRLDVRGDELVLQYDLPELLLGQARGLSFRGTPSLDGNYSLAGDDGVVSCRANGDGWVCDEALVSVQLDLDKMERMLEGLPETEALARRSVADRFADDPIGVLIIQP